ncbi:Pro-rich N-terminal domain-containing protein [Streptomyces sp. SCSIO 75703]|uniref:Pro-rich N-terminal domain-containing protein n=1 Tax=unclassified Streptomyces TaxID=2593676 RepID=UPI0004BE48E4|nr:Pro-rich N-terminal domain-containing protein [Streptomyces sp. NRRL F-5065]
MQHAVGSPLPPPHQPGHGPAAGWSPAAHQPGPHHQGPAPVPPPPGHPMRAPRPGTPPPGPQRPGAHQPGAGQPGVPHPGPPRTGAPHPTAPGQPPAPQHPAPHAPATDVTGHVPLPPGGPVAAPHLPGAPSAMPDPATATLAVLLIGPAGAGKTTVAKYWADHRRVPTAHISLDDVREWVRSGFADPQSGWNDHSEAQYRLARRTCGFSARNFLANGISCILDDAVFPDRPVVGLGGWKRHVGPGLLPVVLLPGLDIVLERNAARSGNRRLTDEEVARIHGRMAGWYGSGLPIIDNSQLGIAETARVLDEVLARSIASPPQW